MKNCNLYPILKNQSDESFLFTRLVEQYGRSEAVKMYEYLFSDEFVQQYGEWMYGTVKNGLLLNEQGEPESYYFSQVNDINFSPTILFDDEEITFTKETKKEKTQAEILHDHLMTIKNAEIRSLKNARYFVNKQLEKENLDPTIKKQLESIVLLYDNKIEQAQKERIEYRGLEHSQYMLSLVEGDNPIADKELAKLSQQITNKTFIRDNYQSYRKIIDFWRAVLSPKMDNELLSPEFIELYRDKLQTLYNQIERIEEQFSSIGTETLLAKVTSEKGKPVVKEELLKSGEDVGFFTKLFRDVGVIDHPLVQFIYRLVKKADDKARIEANKHFRKIDALSKDFKRIVKQGLLNEDDFWQKDESGKKTGRLVGLFSSAYWNKRHTFIESIKELNAQDKAKQWDDWNQENEFQLELRYLFADTEEGYAPTKENETAYMKKIENAVGPENVEFVLKRAKKEYESYLKERQYKKDTLTPSEYKTWIKYHSVFGSNSKVFIPLKYRSNGKETGFYDSAYQRIQSIPEAKAYYDYLQPLMREMYYNMPFDKRGFKEFQSLPFIRKSLIEKLREDTGEGTKHLRYALINEFQSRTDQIEVGEGFNLLTKEQEKEIQTPFTTTILSEIEKRLKQQVYEYALLHEIEFKDVPEHVKQSIKEEVAQQVLSEQTTDLNMIAKIYTINALHNKHREAVKNTVFIAREHLKRLDKKIINNAGEVIKSSGNELNVKGIGTLNDMVDYFLDTVFYRMPKREDKASEIKIKNVYQKERIAEYKEKIAEIKKTNPKNTKAIEYYERAIQEQEGSLGFSRIGDMILKYIQAKGMGLNLPAGIINLGFGAIANIVEASGSQSIDMDQIMYGYRQAINKKRTEGIMHTLNVLKKGSEEIYEQSSLSWLYWIQDATEKYNQGPIMYALLKKYGIDDAFDENGELIKEIDEKTLTDYKMELDRLIVRLHGNYDPSLPLLGTKQLWGRALLQFRKWAIEGFASRIEKERYDDSLQVVVKGRYRSGFAFGSNVKNVDGEYVTVNGVTMGPIMQTLYGLRELIVRVSTLGFKSTSYYENLQQAGISEVDVANLRRNMAETIIYLGLIGITALIQGAIDDDEEEGISPVWTSLYNMTLRLQSDILFYTNPTEFERIISNPIPAMRVFQDLKKIIESWYGITFEDMDSELQSGPFEGDSRIVRDVLNFLPIGSQINRIRRMSYELYDK